MSVSLYYSTTTPVEPAAAAAIQKDVTEDHTDWWAEGIRFYDGMNGELSGSTKMFRNQAWIKDGPLADISTADDFLMTWRDWSMIVKLLSFWSHQHGLTWTMRMEDNLLGHVTPAGPDADLLTALQDMLQSSSISEAQAPTEIARVQRTYTDR